MITIEESNYIQWIIEMFDCAEHTCLIKQLMTIPFEIHVPLDGNLYPCVRAFRKRLRIGYDGPKGSPSVLEIFCALAVECEEKLMSNENFGNRTTTWFWAMLYNLGVNIYDDIHYTARVAEDVEDKVYMFLDRTYDYYGEGNIFTVNRPYYDMRVAPLWEQMNWWLTENYSEEFKMEL